MTLSFSPRERNDLLKSIKSVLDTELLILGESVARFEHDLAETFTTPHKCVAVANGTDAISLALAAAASSTAEERRADADEVIIPAFAPVPVIVGVLRAGLRPVLVDVDKATGLLDPVSTLEALSERTLAVLVVHLYGNRGPTEVLLPETKRRGVWLIEDISQAYGGRYVTDGQLLGSKGDAAVLSLYPTKNLAALGDAGAVISPHESLIRDVIQRRQYGWDATRESVLSGGWNSRMDTLQASVLLTRLKTLEVRRTERLQQAKWLNAFAEHEALGEILTQTDALSFPHLYVIRGQDRSESVRQLSNLGITAQVHYDRALHQHSAFKEFSTDNLKNAEELAATVVTLPWQWAAEQIG